MRSVSVIAALALALLAARCSHAPPITEPEPLLETPRSEGLDDDSSDDVYVALHADDESFLDQSLEQALNPWNGPRLAHEVESHIREASQGGRFSLVDKSRSRPRRLRLDKIHADRVLTLEDGRAAVCVDFVDDNGDRLDVDFLVKRSDSDETDSIDGYEIHRLNGQPRYSYLPKDGVWVTAPATATP